MSPFATPSDWQRQELNPRGQSGRQLRQCTRRNHQWTVQGWTNPPPWTMENQGIVGTGHPGVGALVQPPKTTWTDQLYPSGRSWGKLLPATRRSARDGGMT